MAAAPAALRIIPQLSDTERRPACPSTDEPAAPKRISLADLRQAAQLRREREAAEAV
jgi:hypothetical protein